MLHQQTHQKMVGFCFIVYGVVNSFSYTKTEQTSGMTAILTAIKLLCNTPSKITWNLHQFFPCVMGFLAV